MAWQAGRVTLPEWMRDDQRVRHVHHRPAAPGVTADFPEWLDEPIREAIGRLGVSRPWRHQVEAAEQAFAGRHVALATPTASGKTLAYLMPTLAALVGGRLGRPLPGNGLIAPRHTALYLAPTKALAHDQWRTCRSLELPGFRFSTLDGDSDEAERRFARDYAGLILSNPDMVHRSVLPNHTRFSRLLGSLRYVVIDEAHRYRGVFGAQVSAVLRRLRRLARHYGADPVFVSCSATIAGAQAHLLSLAGVAEAVAVETDTSRRPALDFCLWQPEEDAHAEAAMLLSRLVAEGRQTLAFTTSRVQAELVARRAQQHLGDTATISSYRAGYLAEDRRTIERGLQTGELRGVACTNALELGVDIAGMDAVISCGFPGTLASLWQQAGRGGGGRAAPPPPGGGAGRRVRGGPGPTPSRSWSPGRNRWTPICANIPRRSSASVPTPRCCTPTCPRCSHRTWPRPPRRSPWPRPTPSSSARRPSAWPTNSPVTASCAADRPAGSGPARSARWTGSTCAVRPASRWRSSRRAPAG